MRTLVVNASPKAKNGNTEVFIKKFTKGMKEPCEISYAAKEDSLQLAQYMKQFDTVIVAMPLYIHAMPGIVMKLIECMEPTSDNGKAMGFIVQSGFMESAQSKYLERYLSALTKRLNYTYIGTVIKGGSAGVYMMPEKMNKRLFQQLHLFGEHFEINGSFCPEVVAELAKPHQLSKGKCRSLQFWGRLCLGDAMFWNMMLKKNHAFNRRLDKPFADKLS